jgi:hypothetical protein
MNPIQFTCLKPIQSEDSIPDTASWEEHLFGAIDANDASAVQRLLEEASGTDPDATMATVQNACRHAARKGLDAGLVLALMQFAGFDRRSLPGFVTREQDRELALDLAKAFLMAGTRPLIAKADKEFASPELQRLLWDARQEAKRNKHGSDDPHFYRNSRYSTEHLNGAIGDGEKWFVCRHITAKLDEALHEAGTRKALKDVVAGLSTRESATAVLERATYAHLDEEAGKKVDALRNRHDSEPFSPSLLGRLVTDILPTLEPGKVTGFPLYTKDLEGGHAMTLFLERDENDEFYVAVHDPNPTGNLMHRTYHKTFDHSQLEKLDLNKFLLHGYLQAYCGSGKTLLVDRLPASLESRGTGRYVEDDAAAKISSLMNAIASNNKKHIEAMQKQLLERCGVVDINDALKANLSRFGSVGSILFKDGINAFLSLLVALHRIPGVDAALIGKALDTLLEKCDFLFESRPGNSESLRSLAKLAHLIDPSVIEAQCKKHLLSGSALFSALLEGDFETIQGLQALLQLTPADKRTALLLCIEHDERNIDMTQLLFLRSLEFGSQDERKYGKAAEAFGGLLESLPKAERLDFMREYDVLNLAFKCERSAKDKFGALLDLLPPNDKIALLMNAAERGNKNVYVFLHDLFDLESDDAKVHEAFAQVLAPMSLEAQLGMLASCDVLQTALTKGCAGSDSFVRMLTRIPSAGRTRMLAATGRSNTPWIKTEMQKLMPDVAKLKQYCALVRNLAPSLDPHECQLLLTTIRESHGHRSLIWRNEAYYTRLVGQSPEFYNRFKEMKAELKRNAARKRS